MEYARTVVIPLKHGIGRYVRVQLEFDSKWMLVSEVQFRSGRWRDCPSVDNSSTNEVV